MLSTKEIINYLNEIADLDVCDGNCDLYAPFLTRCDRCEASHVLNDIGEIARDAYEKIMQENLIQFRHLEE
jgi:hypothetical protein